MHRFASLLALGLACGGDSGGAGTVGETGTGASSTSGGPTSGAQEDTDAAPTTASPTTVSPTTDGPVGDTTSEDPTGTTATTSGGTTGPAMTTDEPPPMTTDEPPPDPCAGQDEAPPEVEQPGGLNEDPRYIQVYINNVENLKSAGETCEGDWTDLIFYMKSYKPSPDLFLVQQISNSAQLDTLVQRMNTELVGAFDGIIAEAEPKAGNFPCGHDKDQQTNAIVFRTGRFEKTGLRDDWLAWASDGGDGCMESNQPRTRAVLATLHDKIADKDVTVASIHWSTASGTGDDPACAKKNIDDVHAHLHKAEFAADLYIFGGDFNESDRNANNDYRAWYAKANGNLGGAFNYRDPVYRMCEPLDLLACLADNWTIGNGNRIDMMFAQDGQGCRAKTRHAHTVTFNEADDAAAMFEGQDQAGLDYSDHRAVRAEVYY